ncbi:MAG: hypothetical protein JNG85_02120, partial [Spirochaetaceae bacterium]|nr:hypothetical protein [Spirochaetaceae bacterium]
MRDAVAAMGREELEEEVYAARLGRERPAAVGDAFLGAATHELRTPLNAILGFTEVLLQGLSGPLNETQARQLQSVDREAKRLLGLVNEVLDYSKARAGALELGREAFDLGRAAAAAAAGMEAEAARRGLEFRIEAEEGACLAVGDARRAEQVTRHLV